MMVFHFINNEELVLHNNWKQIGLSLKFLLSSFQINFRILIQHNSLLHKCQLSLPWYSLGRESIWGSYLDQGVLWACHGEGLS